MARHHYRKQMPGRSGGRNLRRGIPRVTFKIYPDKTLDTQWIPERKSVSIPTGDIRDADERLFDWARKNGWVIDDINHTGRTVKLSADDSECESQSMEEEFF